MPDETDGARPVVTRDDVEAARRRAVELAQRCARAGVPVPPVPPFLLDCRLAGLVRLLIERGLITAEELDAAAAEEQARTLGALLEQHTAPKLLVPRGVLPGGV